MGGHTRVFYMYCLYFLSTSPNLIYIKYNLCNFATDTMSSLIHNKHILALRVQLTQETKVVQVIKTFSTREGWWYIGIKGDGGVKSKGTRLLIEKEK